MRCVLAAMQRTTLKTQANTHTDIASFSRYHAICFIVLLFIMIRLSQIILGDPWLKYLQFDPTPFGIKTI